MTGPRTVEPEAKGGGAAPFAREHERARERPDESAGAVHPPTRRSVVLAYVALGRRVEVRLALFCVAACSGSHVVGVHVGTEGDMPSEVVGTSLPVGFLGIEEELFVERTDFGERLGAEQEDRTDQEVVAATEAAEPHGVDPWTERGGEGPSHSHVGVARRVRLCRCDAGTDRLGHGGTGAERGLPTDRWTRRG